MAHMDIFRRRTVSVVRCAGLSGCLLAWAVGQHAAGQFITTTAGVPFIFPPTPIAALQAPLGSPKGMAVDAAGNI
jgi:hypothetical protein